ncbi:cytochrome P450 87A3 [Aegilops tauschii subsp. strangulata]|uniref:Cytochrome P450 87A3 n=1 Tax=Aegilops tauschii subsp. strangulata TaxID=200361 RepID=A0A453CEX0_AEGTS|nr:cytochrome P450 87A3 [Aegilops tauschii subsp. strangulata]
MQMSVSIPVALATPWVVLVGMAALLAAWLVHLVIRWNVGAPCKAGAVLPPGSRGLPVLGESLEFFARSPSLELTPFLKRRLERYGPIFRTNLIGEDLIVSLDQDLNNLVFQKEEKLFQIWYPESLMRIMGADCIIATLGTFHKHLRTLVLRLFGPENLRVVLLHEVQQTAQASLLSWLGHPSIEVKEATSSMIFSITAKRLISYDSSSSDGKLWKQFDAFLQGLLAFPLYIPGTAFYKCMQGRKNVMKILKELLNERKKATCWESVDFIDILIDDLKDKKTLMNEKIALDLLFLLLFAGFETTSSGITATLKFLTGDPKALQELTEEHNNIRKRRANPDSEITWEEYKSMKFTSHVIHEALRLANIAPVMFRKATEEVHIKGYTIPKGSKIMVSPSSIHLDPTIYKDPNAFNPWRWKDTTEPMGGSSKEFMAFGGGLRLCVGADFAKLEMAVFLHCLVTKYSWKVIKGGNMVLSPGLQFPCGFHIQLLPKY